MNILYVYAHPNHESFNSLLKQSGYELLKRKHSIIFSDLYAENFCAIASWDDFDLPKTEINPQYFLSQQLAYNQHALTDDINAEIKKITWADHIIFQFPLWWFSTPAILKGWFDRVLVKGFSYDAGKILDDGLLKGKTASLVVTTQSPESAYQVNGIHGASIDTFLHHIHHTLRFVGINVKLPFVSYSVFNMDEQQRNEILKNYQKYLQNLT